MRTKRDVRKGKQWNRRCRIKIVKPRWLVLRFAREKFATLRGAGKDPNLRRF